MEDALRPQTIDLGTSKEGSLQNDSQSNNAAPQTQGGDAAPDEDLTRENEEGK